jgi:hypothetical protein
MRSVTGSLDRLTADLAALGAMPFDEGAGRRPLTWSAYSSTTREELHHDKETMRMERTGQVTATVALRVTVRDSQVAVATRNLILDLATFAAGRMVPRCGLAGTAGVRRGSGVSRLHREAATMCQRGGMPIWSPGSVVHSPRWAGSGSRTGAARR